MGPRDPSKGYVQPFADLRNRPFLLLAATPAGELRWFEQDTFNSDEKLEAALAAWFAECGCEYEVADVRRVDVVASQASRRAFRERFEREAPRL
jgi:hypothetical protein